MKAKRRSCDIDLLIQWEFQFFKQFSIYKDEEDFFTALNSLLSHRQFQLITKLMSNAKKFTSQEVVELFQLGDKFLASGKTKEKIFSLFIVPFLLGNIENVSDLLPLYLWNDFTNYLKSNSAIEMDKNVIRLNGLRVSLETKEGIFVLLKNLAKHYKVLYICDIPLCSNDLKVIHSDLIELHIENCPFNFEEQLDLSQLTHLTHFTCSNCFADCHLPFTLESFTCNLEYLDISGNLLNPIDHTPLVNWIEKQKLLKHLNLSDNNLTPRSAPSLFNVLFDHPSLEVLNLKDNYIGIQFLKQLRSFPGTLNWKSLTINGIDKPLKYADVLSVFFSKLTQLEFLDMSDSYEQQFSSSLLKGISELTNLKNFVFNSEINIAYSNAIENLFKNNSNLELILKKHIIKSFEDWKLSISHPHCKIEELIENESTKNASQLIYRNIQVYLNSSNNRLFQIENLISKFKGVDGLKLYLTNVNYNFNLKNSKNYPPPIEACIIYETVSDLRNILSCMNYLRTASFHFAPMNCYEDHPYDILLEIKSSPHWESIEELELSFCDINIFLKIITEINLPNLKSLYLKSVYTADRNAQLICPEAKIPSLQSLSLTFYALDYLNDALRILSECFPNMTELKIFSSKNSLDDFSIAALPKGLRCLDIYTAGRIKNLDILNDLNNFPLLTKLVLPSGYMRYSKLGSKKKIYLPNLTELIVPQWIVKSVKFVIPKLRKLNMSGIFDSSLTHLKDSPKLKSILLSKGKVKTPREIIDSGLLLSFPNLNEFCDPMNYYKFNHDSATDDISKSLIHLDVHDSDSFGYYHQNEDGKRLQEKKIPFLYKFSSDIVERNREFSL